MDIRFDKIDIQEIINSLDLYSRVWIGQNDHLLFELRFLRNCSQLDSLEKEFIKLFMQIRDIILPNISYVGFYGSYGIFNTDVDYRAAIAYNMQQVFRYELAYFEHPEGGITVDFSKPLTAENDPYQFPTAKCFSINNNTYIDINVCKEQLDVIKNALCVKQAFADGNITKLFSYYTDNEEIFNITRKIDHILKNIDFDYRYPDTIKQLIGKLEKI